ncbi:DMT family transporter [Glycomyces sp. NPDC046736]|uniref:DMT family transporter n=1 Tax=Glycomyces sp. NPDC046736 TaxID=3155615 RepID=UPI0033F15629
MTAHVAAPPTASATTDYPIPLATPAAVDTPAAVTTTTTLSPLQRHPFLLGPGLSIAFVVMWTGGYIAGPIGVSAANPLALCFWRFGIAAAALTLLAVLTRARWPESRAAWGQVIATGLLMQAGMFSFAYLGLSLGAPVALVAIANGASPVLVALGGVLLLRERLLPVQWGGTLLGFAGLALAVTGEWTGFAIGAAALLPVAGAIAFAAGTLVQRRTGARMDLRSGSAIQMAVAAAVTMPLAMIFEGGLYIPVTQTTVGAIAFLVVGNSGAAAALTFLMLRHRKAADSTRLMLLVAPLATLSAWPLFGQLPGPMLWIGLAVTIVGIALATRHPRHAATT